MQSSRSLEVACVVVLLLHTRSAAGFLAPAWPVCRSAKGQFSQAPFVARRSVRPLLVASSTLQSSDGDSEASEDPLISLEEVKTAAVRVVSYNVLSSDLCEADYHVKCTAQNLDQKNRLRKVIDKLNDEVEKGAVICLQEVSTKWAGQLHCFFAESGYHMVHMGYGNKFDGYMGVAMAFPLATYKLQKCRIERTADLRRWPKRPSMGFRKRTIDWLQGKWRQFRGVKAPIDPMVDAKRRANQLVSMRLQDRESGVGFVVGTYHMPCQFRVPEVMVIHMALALRELQLSAQNSPLIFCGDFNVKPGDAPYLLATEGTLHPSNEHYPPRVPDDKWQPKVEYGMRSAYKEALGAEPPLTNWAFTRGSDQDFKDCLDYIFVSKGVDVDAVLPLDGAATAQGPFPNAEEPSDHVMIAADLKVTANANSDGKRFARSGTRRDLDPDAQLEEFREQVAAFMGDDSQAQLSFRSSLNSFERMLVHRLSEQYGLHSSSVGQGRSRRITIYKQKLA